MAEEDGFTRADKRSPLEVWIDCVDIKDSRARKEYLLQRLNAATSTVKSSSSSSSSSSSASSSSSSSSASIQAHDSRFSALSDDPASDATAEESAVETVPVDFDLDLEAIKAELATIPDLDNRYANFFV